MDEFLKRPPRLWIGLASAALAIVACLCVLVFVAVLAGLRSGRPIVSIATLNPNLLDSSPTPPTPTPLVGKVTAPPSSKDWPLNDVPMPAEADLGTLIGSPEAFSVITDQDFSEVLAFYQTEMESQGWSKVSYGTRITENDAMLQYRKDNTHVTVTLAGIPFIGTLVEVRTQAL